MEDRKLRARFKNAALDERFEKDGYVLIRNWADQKQVAKMLEVFDKFYKAPDFTTNIFNTLVMVEDEERKIISDRLMEQLRPSLEKHLYDYESTFGYFLTKPVYKELREVVLHSDSSSVNEDKYEYIVIWLPLIDLDKRNGCMYIVPGSQKLFTYEQPFSIEWPYPHLAEKLKRYALDLPMKAGDLLIFSGKTIHGSYPNRSKDPRPVVGSGLIHPATEMLFNYYDRDKNMVKAYEVDVWFYFRNQYGEPKEGKFTLKRSYTFNPPEVSYKMIKQFFARNPVKYNSRFPFLRRLGLNV